jgi:DNA mismatch endonuclease, patch repair protein
MRAIRSKNTRPEIFVRKALHAAGFRYRLHSKNLPGKPDIVLPKYRIVIFVQGCFWHGHDCKYFKVPKTRAEFWGNKITENKSRDKINIDKLTESGWQVLLVWECATKSGSQGLSDFIRSMEGLKQSAKP